METIDEIEKENEKEDIEEVLSENGQKEDSEDKNEREAFWLSRFVVFGLVVVLISSVCVLAFGAKDRAFHIFYIILSVAYLVFYFFAVKKLPLKFCIHKKFLRILFDVADCMSTVVVALVFAYYILDFFKISVVDGQSMDHTLHNGQKLILGAHSYTFENIERGDIVVCYAPNLEEYIIKRVIGKPGEHLQIKDNQVYIDDKKLNEPYIAEPMITGDIDIVVPEGKLFVMGDNRNRSGDSREERIGFIDIESQLQGKIVFESLFGID